MAIKLKLEPGVEVEMFPCGLTDNDLLAIFAAAALAQRSPGYEVAEIAGRCFDAAEVMLAEHKRRRR